MQYLYAENIQFYGGWTLGRVIKGESTKHNEKELCCTALEGYNFFLE